MSEFNMFIMLWSLIRWKGNPNYFAFLLYSIFFFSLRFIEKFFIFYKNEKLSCYPVIYLFFRFAFARFIWILILVASLKLNRHLCGRFGVIVTFDLNALLWTKKLGDHSKHVILIPLCCWVKSSFLIVFFISWVNNEILSFARGYFNISKIGL